MTESPTAGLPTIPSDPDERREYFRKLGSRGGSATAESDNAVRPFKDKELASAAGKSSKRGLAKNGPRRDKATSSTEPKS